MANKEDIGAELKEAAPLLAGIPKSNPFTISDNYFKEAESGILIAAGINEVSENNFGAKRAPFNLPQNYFENLPSKILERVKKEADKKSGSGRIIRMKRRWWLAAASVILIIIVSLSVFRKQPISTLTSTVRMDTTYILFENVTGLSEASVVDLYALDQPASSEDSSLNQFLIEASGIDAEVIYSL